MTEQTRSVVEKFVLTLLDEDADKTMGLSEIKSCVHEATELKGCTDMIVREALLHLLTEEKVLLTPQRKVQLAARKDNDDTV